MIVESEGHYDSSLRGNELPLSVSSGLVEITSLATHYVYYFHTILDNLLRSSRGL